MEPSSVKVTNICAKFNTGCYLNLDEIYTNEQYLILINKKYDISKFSGLTAKYLDTKITFMIYYTGNVVITGGKIESDIENAVNDLVLLLHLIGPYEAKVINLKFTNYCGSYRFGSKVDILKLCKDKPKVCDYNTELFTSMKYIIDKKRLTVTRNGVIFGTGFKSRDHLNTIFNDAITGILPYISKLNDNKLIENGTTK